VEKEAAPEKPKNQHINVLISVPIRKLALTNVRARKKRLPAMRKQKQRSRQAQPLLPQINIKRLFAHFSFHQIIGADVCMLFQHQATLKQLAPLGVGIGLRHRLLDETLKARNEIDWLEIISENYMGNGWKQREILEQAQDKNFRVIPHGVALSIGSVDAIDEDYLEQLTDLFSTIKPMWFSDHLCFSSVDNVHLHDLLPLPFTWEAVDHVVERIQRVQQRFEIPLLIENISYYTQFGHKEMSEAQFISEILERADCGLLLDVNNVYVNFQNHQEDPIAFLNALPLERVVQIHIAGHTLVEDLIIDTHGEPVRSEVFDLLDYVLPKTAAKGILLERDSNIPDLPELLAEVAQIKQIVEKHTRQEVLVG
jgi:uncharacterized protein